jgi:hypothetical protein
VGEEVGLDFESFAYDLSRFFVNLSSNLFACKILLEDEIRDFSCKKDLSKPVYFSPQFFHLPPIHFPRILYLDRRLHSFPQ